MDYINLGSSGLRVSRLCLGCMTYGEPDRGMQPWSLGEEDSRVFIRKALETGINFFDTANLYSAGSSEEIVGRAIRDFARRDEVVIATKAYFPWRAAPNCGFLSRKSLIHAVDDSLQRLGTDYIDLFQIHRFDHTTPIEETLETLHALIKEGKVRYIGASSMEAWRFAKLQYTARLHGWSTFISMQPHYNLIYREEEREMLPLCLDQGVGVIPWSPLARGALARDPQAQPTHRQSMDGFARFQYADTEAIDRPIIDAVGEIAQQRGVQRAQIALAWLASRPGVVAPIIGVTQTKHLDDAIAALNLVLDEDEVATLEAPYVPHPVNGIHMPVPDEPEQVSVRLSV